jgi:pimeloyl-ACP methyl ester carboxylesterase
MTSGAHPVTACRDATDCRDLLMAMGLGAVHVVGYSYSGAVGLQLAVDAPESPDAHPHLDARGRARRLPRPPFDAMSKDDITL